MANLGLRAMCIFFHMESYFWVVYCLQQTEKFHSYLIEDSGANRKRREWGGGYLCKRDYIKSLVSMLDDEFLCYNQNIISS